MQFKFYVLNYDCNKQQVINYNIFNNINVQKWVEKAVKKYIRAPKKFTYNNFDGNITTGFEGLCEEIRRTLAWQEWSRREYEISVADAFEKDINKLEKWDCYKQALPNIEIIARECIYQYKKQLKGDE